jgi:hypothetical protein
MTPSDLKCRVAPLILVACIAGSCTAAVDRAGQSPAPATEISTIVPSTLVPAASASAAPSSPTPGLSGFTFPTNIEPTARYLFYLHGKIIEDQGLPAISPEYGEYRYEEILKTLQSYGLVVISEQRPRNADGVKCARRVAAQVADLLEHGVPPGSITVVGASKGAAIAIFVSGLVADPQVNYVLLGACDATTIAELVQQGVRLSGNVLAISDSSDEYAGSCESLFALSEGNALGRHAELVLHVGTGHGILYQPLAEWVVPTVKWAKQDW